MKNPVPNIVKLTIFFFACMPITKQWIQNEQLKKARTNAMQTKETFLRNSNSWYTFTLLKLDWNFTLYNENRDENIICFPLLKFSIHTPVLCIKELYDYISIQPYAIYFTITFIWSSVPTTKFMQRALGTFRSLRWLEYIKPVRWDKQHAL